MRFHFMLPLLGALVVAPTGAATGQSADMTFVVLGHLRGDGHGLNHKAAEVLAEVRRARPDAVFLTGDIIWGDYNSKKTDSAAVEAEWNQVDSALATLGVPVYRVPGNHDINDAVTRDIWKRRYGALPQVVNIRGNRFLLIASGWVPAAGDTGKALYIRGKDLDPKQVAFLREQLAQPNPAGHSFVVMHHLLWWEADTASWWREVHPLLSAAKVSMVFSGDYGPMKFSALEHGHQDGGGTVVGTVLAVALARYQCGSPHAPQTVAGPADLGTGRQPEAACGALGGDRWVVRCGRTRRPPEGYALGGRPKVPDAF